MLSDFNKRKDKLTLDRCCSRSSERYSAAVVHPAVERAVGRAHSRSSTNISLTAPLFHKNTKSFHKSLITSNASGLMLLFCVTLGQLPVLLLLLLLVHQTSWCKSTVMTACSIVPSSQLI